MAAWPGTAAAPSAARTLPRWIVRLLTRPGTWPRTWWRPAWRSGARCRCRTRSDARTRHRSMGKRVARVKCQRGSCTSSWAGTSTCDRPQSSRTWTCCGRSTGPPPPTAISAATTSACPGRTPIGSRRCAPTRRLSRARSINSPGRVSKAPVSLPDAALKLRVHDTLSRRKTLVKPSPGKGGQAVRLYVCGVTPYDAGHMGHAFTFCTYDILIRFIEASGVRVRYVQNITDVDDPLFERARRDGVDWRDLADRETAIHLRDMDALGWRRPDFMPRVSDEIEPILSAAGRLDAAGYAYHTDALYFDASLYRGYGQLSRRTRRSMITKLRHEGLLGVVGPGAKRDPVDFPLWRPSEPGGPTWPSRFRDGRPRWHIECTAMAMHYLGEQIDIHGGGRDLAFSHHESERAQSESLTGKKPFARAWVHTGLVRYEGHKMSKSRGNLVKVSQALQRAPAAAVRLYLVSHRYGRDWTFEWKGLTRSARFIERMRKFLADDARFAHDGPRPAPGRKLMVEFNAALADDLDTPRAVRVLRAAVRQGDAPAVRAMQEVLLGSAALS